MQMNHTNPEVPKTVKFENAHTSLSRTTHTRNRLKQREEALVGAVGAHSIERVCSREHLLRTLVWKSTHRAWGFDASGLR